VAASSYRVDSVSRRAYGVDTIIKLSATKKSHPALDVLSSLTRTLNTVWTVHDRICRPPMDFDRARRFGVRGGQRESLPEAH
jgi:hypothetical protein